MKQQDTNYNDEEFYQQIMAELRPGADEYDRLMAERVRKTVRLKPIYKYVAAACIAFAIVGASVQLLRGKAEDTSQRIAGKIDTTNNDTSVPDNSLAQAEVSTESSLTGQPSAEVIPDVHPASVKNSKATHPTGQMLAAASADSQKTKEAEEDEYSEELLYALITEVEAKAMAEEEAKEERLCRTLIEEISTNITKQSNQSNQSELTL